MMSQDGAWVRRLFQTYRLIKLIHPPVSPQQSDYTVYTLHCTDDGASDDSNFTFPVPLPLPLASAIDKRNASIKLLGESHTHTTFRHQPYYYDI